MTRCRAPLPAGDRVVRDPVRFAHVVRESAETAAQDDRHDRLVLRLRSDRGDGRFGVAHVPGSFRIFSRSSERNGRACEVRTNRATVSERRTRDPIAGGEVVLLLAVDRDARRVLHLELDALVGIERDGVPEREMRRDGHEHDRLRARQDERTTDGEAVRGAAGRRRDDDAVRPVDDQRLAVDAHRDVDRAHRGAARDDDVVEREEAHLASLAHQPRVEQRSLLDLVTAGRDIGDRRIEVVDRDRREEPESSEVHAEQRDAERRHRARRAQHRAVAAEDARDRRALRALGFRSCRGARPRPRARPCACAPPASRAARTASGRSGRTQSATFMRRPGPRRPAARRRARPGSPFTA